MLARATNCAKTLTWASLRTKRRVTYEIIFEGE